MPGIGPATVGASQFSLLSALQAKPSTTNGATTSKRPSTFMVQSEPSLANLREQATSFIGRTARADMCSRVTAVRAGRT